MQKGGETAEDKRTLIILKTTMKCMINISLLCKKTEKKHTDDNKIKMTTHAMARKTSPKKIIPK